MNTFENWVATRNPTKTFSTPEKTGRLEDFSPHQLRVLYFQEMATEIERLGNIINKHLEFRQMLKTDR